MKIYTIVPHYAKLPENFPLLFVKLLVSESGTTTTLKKEDFEIVVLFDIGSSRLTVRLSLLLNLVSDSKKLSVEKSRIFLLVNVIGIGLIVFAILSSLPGLFQ